jgi:hypothetical protein
MVQTDVRLPAQIRVVLLSQFLTSKRQMPPGRTTLVQMTNDHPSWHGSRDELAVLSQQIEQVFERQTVAAYTSIWALAAVFPLLGIGFVIALLIVVRRATLRAKTQMVAWNSFYFFSLSGGITAQTIHCYLAAQPPPIVPGGPPKHKRGNAYLPRETGVTLTYAWQKGA